MGEGKRQSIWTRPISQWHPAARAMVTVPLILLALWVAVSIIQVR